MKTSTAPPDRHRLMRLLDDASSSQGRCQGEGRRRQSTQMAAKKGGRGGQCKHAEDKADKYDRVRRRKESKTGKARQGGKVSTTGRGGDRGGIQRNTEKSPPHATRVTTNQHTELTKGRRTAVMPGFPVTKMPNLKFYLLSPKSLNAKQ